MVKRLTLPPAFRSHCACQAPPKVNCCDLQLQNTEVELRLWKQDVHFIWFGVDKGLKKWPCMRRGFVTVSPRFLVRKSKHFLLVCVRAAVSNNDWSNQPCRNHANRLIKIIEGVYWNQCFISFTRSSYLTNSYKRKAHNQIPQTVRTRQYKWVQTSHERNIDRINFHLIVCENVLASRPQQDFSCKLKRGFTYCENNFSYKKK